MDQDRDFWEAAQRGAEYLAIRDLRRGDTDTARLHILDANEARDMVLTGAEIEARYS